MNYIIELEGVKYSVWSNHSPEHYITQIKEGMTTIESCLNMCYFSKDITLSHDNLNRLSRKNRANWLFNFDLKDGNIVYSTSFEVDTDEDEHFDLDEFLEHHDAVYDGYCDGAYYFKTFYEDIILKEEDYFFLSEDYAYLKYVTAGSKGSFKKILIQIPLSVKDEFDMCPEVIQKIKQVW